jgi:hypothetical protein
MWIKLTSRNFKFSHNFIHYHYYPSTLIPELSAMECLAELQASKKRMEEQEAELKVAAEEE